MDNGLLSIEQTEFNFHKTGYYVLQTVGKNSNNIKISLNTIDGEIEFTDFELFKMLDGNTLVAINGISGLFSDFSMIAKDDESSEIINTQLFERIYKYYNQQAESKKGFFIFENSVPIPENGYGWRCDRSRFGPQFFMKNDVDYEPLFSNLSEIIACESILSVSKVGHIMYVHGIRDMDVESFHLEEYELPRAAKTLQELLKLITEWFEVSEEPWGNTESISVKAKEFINKLQFSNEFIEEIKNSQEDMQVVKFLKGDPNAKLQNENYGEITSIIDTEIKKKTSHYSLSHVLSLFPGCFDNIDEIYEKELSIVLTKQKNLLNELGIDSNNFNSDESETIVDALRQKNGRVSSFRSVYINCLGSHLDILNSLNY